MDGKGRTACAGDEDEETDMDCCKEVMDCCKEEMDLCNSWIDVVDGTEEMGVEE